jgi:hypothetical protein
VSRPGADPAGTSYRTSPGPVQAPRWQNQGPAPTGGPYQHAGQRRAAWAGSAAAAVGFWLLATTGRPWRLFERGPFTADFFDAQARSLTRLRLDVPPEVAGIEGFVVGGRTQLYYGLVPALFRVPVAAVTDALDGRLTLASQLVAVVVLGLASARLLVRAARAVDPAHQVPVWQLGAFAAAATLATPVWWLASRAVVYHEVELWGAAAAVAGLGLVLRWWEDRRPASLAAAAAVAAVALSSRASSGSAPVLALGLVALVAAGRRRWPAALAAGAAAVPAVAFYAAVNLARFGTVASVPFEDQVFSSIDPDRQAALAANGGSLFGPQFVPTTVAHYLSPLAVGPMGLFPFTTWSERATVVGEATFDTIDRSGSITSGAPALVLMAVIGGWWVVRRDRSGGWRVVLAAAVAATAATLSIGFIAHRYLVDLVPAVLVAAAPGAVLVDRWYRRSDPPARRRAGRPPGWGRWWPVTARRTAVAALAALALLGAWAQAGLALQARHLYVLPTSDDRLAFTRIQVSVHRLLTGGPPAVVVVASGELPPAAGHPEAVAVADRCAGLYRSDGERWWSLEHRAGAGRRLVLRPAGAGLAGGAVIASGRAWELRLEAAGGAWVATYRAEDGPVEVISEPFSATAASTFDVVADTATTELRLRVDEALVLDRVFVSTADLRPGPHMVSIPVPAPLCEDLLRSAQGA